MGEHVGSAQASGRLTLGRRAQSTATVIAECNDSPRALTLTCNKRVRDTWCVRCEWWDESCMVGADLGTTARGATVLRQQHRNRTRKWVVTTKVGTRCREGKVLLNEASARKDWIVGAPTSLVRWRPRVVLVELFQDLRAEAQMMISKLASNAGHVLRGKRSAADSQFMRPQRQRWVSAQCYVQNFADTCIYNTCHPRMRSVKD
jgi:hypothetical protein